MCEVDVEVEVGNVQVVFAWGRNATTATRSSATWVGTYSSLKRQQGNHQHSPIVNSQNAYLGRYSTYDCFVGNNHISHFE